MTENYSRRSGSSGSRSNQSSRNQRAGAASSRQNSRDRSVAPSTGQPSRRASSTRQPQGSSTRSGSQQRSRRVQGSTTRPAPQPSKSTQSQRLSGRTVADERRRISRAKSSKRGVSSKLVAIFAALIVIAIGGFALYHSGFLTITEVRVDGAQRLTAQRLADLAAVPSGSTLLRVDGDSITKRLESDPWVKSAQIDREFPATLVLVIEERQIAAVVDILADTPTGASERWLIGYDGIWLEGWTVDSLSQSASSGGSTDGTTGGDDEGIEDGTETNADTGAVQEKSLLDNVKVFASEFESVPLIKDVVRTIDPVSGEEVTDEGIVNALDIINGFTPEMRAEVAIISAPDKVKTELTLKNYVHVAFGLAEDIPNKEAAILALLSEHEGSITYINVRVASRATYRVAE